MGFLLSLLLPERRRRDITHADAYAGLTEALCAAVRPAVRWVEGEVKLPSEESTVVCVDQLKHALMDDIRLKTGTDQHLAAATKEEKCKFQETLESGKLW